MNILPVSTCLKDGFFRPQNGGDKVRNKKTGQSSAAEKSSAVPEKKIADGLPGALVKKVQMMAREDAKKGIYMGDEYIAYINSYKTRYISPNRSRLIALATPLLRNGWNTNGKTIFFQLCDLFTARMQTGMMMGPSMSIYDKSGTEILSYDANNGWMPLPSRAEDRFYDDTTQIYYQAYEAAEAQEKAGPGQTGESDSNPGLDRKV